MLYFFGRDKVCEMLVIIMVNFKINDQKFGLYIGNMLNFLYLEIDFWVCMLIVFIFRYKGFDIFLICELNF